MKHSRLEAAPQLNQEAVDAVAAQIAGPDDASQSGIRPAVAAEPMPRAAVPAPSSDVTVVFRGVLPMERLVQLIRRRADEAVAASPLRVEIEQLPEAQRWRVRLLAEHGEIAAALEPGPFLAVTRAFAQLQ
jgi:hypothetical protein